MAIRNKKYKRSGSILASVMVAAIVWIMIAQSMFITFSGQFKMISSSRTALQAQQYAEIALDKLKNINYDELDAAGAHGRKKIEGISSDDWQDEVTIGAESTIAGSDDAKQRIATVNVYKVGDTLPRYTVEVPLSSQGSNSNSNSFPDYSRRYLLAQNKEYIAETNGYVYIYWWDCPSHYRTGYLTIDGMKFVIGAAYGNCTNQHHKTVFFPISKGSSYLIDGDVYYQAIYFVPCK